MSESIVLQAERYKEPFCGAWRLFINASCTIYFSAHNAIVLRVSHSRQKGSLMSQQKPITERILEFLRGTPGCDFEALVTRYPEFSWNELYLEVSRLNRHGLVKITRGVGIFTIHATPVLP
jgi:hypothetical protein